MEPEKYQETGQFIEHTSEVTEVEKLEPEHSVKEVQENKAIQSQSSISTAKMLPPLKFKRDTIIVEEINERKKTKVRIGTFRIGADSFLTRDYIFIPSAYMKSPTFNIEALFDMMDVNMPNILFRVFQTPKAKNWNVCLPPSREFLAREQTFLENDSEEEEEDGVSGPLKHYHGVLRENCKRLLLGTGLACKKAGAGFRITESWNPEAREDAVAGWITDDNRANVLALGCADYKDYHPDIWKQLEEGMSFAEEGDAEAVQLLNGAKDVIIDPEPFYNDEIEVTRDPKTKRIKGSFPHPGMTHLLLSDNLELLEKKLAEYVPWGLIMVNGSVAAADYYVQAIQQGLPTILFQYTGYTTDMAVKTYKKAKKLIAAKKHNPHALATRAFPDSMAPGHHLPKWLKPFDANHISDCQKLNILLENWPSKFNEDSVFIVDMFSTTEDELQDRLTQTMGVVFGPQHEVGGHMSESKRLTFAWRTRAKYLFNARKYKLQSDVLSALLVLFTLFSTVSAVVYTFLFYNEHIELDVYNCLPSEGESSASTNSHADQRNDSSFQSHDEVHGTQECCSEAGNGNLPVPNKSGQILLPKAPSTFQRQKEEDSPPSGGSCAAAGGVCERDGQNSGGVDGF